MNIVTPVPTNIVFTTSNVNTEAARRDNQLRETVPQTSASENSAAESGLGSESDRVRQPGQQSAPVTYERPQSQQNQGANGEGRLNKDNGEDPSAGKEDAEARQEEQKQQAEQKEIQELKARDQEVRAHEQAHASVGGQYAGAPSYDFETGPDGRQYAVGGEVSIDISEERSPEETLRKMQQVKAAALAPAEPSPQDLRVASEATQKAAEARSEIAQDTATSAQQAVSSAFDGEQAERQVGPDLEDIVQGSQVGPPTRSLKEDPVAEAAGLEMDGTDFKARLESRDEGIVRRAAVIENFYQQVATPKAEGLQQSA